MDKVPTALELGLYNLNKKKKKVKKKKQLWLVGTWVLDPHNGERLAEMVSHFVQEN